MHPSPASQMDSITFLMGSGCKEMEFKGLQPYRTAAATSLIHTQHKGNFTAYPSYSCLPPEVLALNALL